MNFFRYFANVCAAHDVRPPPAERGNYMKTRILSGAGLGILWSTLSWFGNLRSPVPGSLSTFPDLITLLAIPVLTFLALLLARGQSDLTRGVTRRAGTIIVSIGTTLFAFSSTILGIVRLSHPTGFSWLY
jgi:hypothetical protein